MFKDKIIYGKIITLDDKDTIAEAMYIKNGRIAAVGSRTQIQKYKKTKTLALDYGDNCIYPGFMDAHMHGSMAATQEFGYVDLSSGKSIEDYIDIMKKYIADHPSQSVYVGTNWLIQILDRYPTRYDLDAIKTDAMIYMMTEDKHLIWVNSKVVENLHIGQNFLKKYGKTTCRTFANGQPTGVFADAQAMSIISSIKLPVDAGRRGFIEWQKRAFSLGYTAVNEAAATELNTTQICSRYAELVEAGIWKLRTYAVYLIQPTKSNWKHQLQRVKEYQKKFNSEYFNIYGVKVFEDGVIEAHTAWMLEDYSDDPGNCGKPIISNKNHLINVISEANSLDLAVHVHSIGDAATKFVTDAMVQSQNKTKIKNPRNTIAHLEIVAKDDIVKIGKNHIIACVAPLWIPLVGSYARTELKLVGQKRCERLYPIQSFVKAKALTVFHSDYPGSHSVSIVEALFRAITRYSSTGGKESVRTPQEAVSRQQALYSMTRNIAYSFKQEKNLGTIEVGKVANFTIFNTDFLTCPVSQISKAKLVNTIVDGEIVY